MEQVHVLVRTSLGMLQFLVLIITSSFQNDINSPVGTAEKKLNINFRKAKTIFCYVCITMVTVVIYSLTGKTCKSLQLLVKM